jgi:hypothetical protein
MRAPGQKQGEVDRKVEEVMLLESNALATSLLDHPRSCSSQPSTSSVEKDSRHIEVLCAWSQHRMHLFLDASIHLGSIATKDSIITANVTAERGDLALCVQIPEDPATFYLQEIPTLLGPHSSRFKPLLQLQTLSTHAFRLSTYCYDSIITIRNLYRTTHINCITPWIQKGKSVNRSYSTNFATEMQMLLLTSSANESITSVLAGNETMTEGDLNKMRIELSHAWPKMVGLVEGLSQALQRAVIVFEEVKGCHRWTEQYGSFLQEDQGAVIESILHVITTAQPQTVTLIRNIQQESRCWAHFYKWWKYERTRQEAIRDQVDEPKSEVSFDVLLLVDFFKRGFANYALERQIGIVFDKKTRGTYIEDDEEEEGEGEKGRDESECVEVDLDTSFTEGDNHITLEQTRQESRQAWHSRPLFLDRLKAIQEDLQRLPDRQEQKESSAPSSKDLRFLASLPFIHSGSSKGLYERRSGGSKVQKPVDLLKSVGNVIQQSSALFLQAFTHYAQQDHPSERAGVRLGYPLSPFRPDALHSTARLATPAKETQQSDPQAPRQAKSVYDDKTGHQWMLSVGCDEQGQSVLLQIVRHDLARKTTEVFYVQCEGVIVDAGFYSNQEVVVLLRQHGTGGVELTSMASFRLDTLRFTSDDAASLTEAILPLQRHYELGPRDAGHGANQLSLNHGKDVAATLSSDGTLVYWDFVLLGEGDTVDGDEVMT